MKKIFTFIISLLLIANAWAQSPEKMSYQAVIRDNSNNLVTNQKVGMQISILNGSADGIAVYVESQTPASNANGLVSLEIGTGATSDSFSSIDWTEGPFFIKTETDPLGGDNYSITGVSQLLSVPYAMHAKTAENISGEINETDPVYTVWDKSTGISITETQISDLQNYLTSEVDPQFASWDKESGIVITESQISDLKTYLTEEIDPVYTSWNKSTGINITESQISDLQNYLTAEVDGSVTNEIELPTQTGNSGKILTTNGTSPAWSSVSFNDLTNVPANLDKDATDDFDGSFSSLVDVPVGLSDGDDDTRLSEDEVDTFVSNNGYLTAEVDGSVTNEIELPTQTGNSGKILTTNGTSPAWSAVSFNDLIDVPLNLDVDFSDDFNGSFTSLTDIPAGLNDGDDVLTEDEVDTYVSNNGYLTAEVDGSVTNELQNFAQVLAQSNDGGAKQIKNIADPTEDQDAATKAYIDARIAEIYGVLYRSKDFEGNSYEGVKIGNQLWMGENLKTTHYANGDEIEDGSDLSDYSGEVEPKYWFAYDDDLNNIDTYGRLYTWYVATDERNVCPDGWHIPSHDDWAELFTFLGGVDNAGGKLKEIGLEHWNEPNNWATDEVNFKGLPAGGRYYASKSYMDIGKKGHWWSTEEFEYLGELTHARDQVIEYDERKVSSYADTKKFGYSIRCIKD
ncbi:MAG: fibrobacter succinogenes major paralogous domain-containing protein [Bacteroidales bacterium]|nr:fibrobacter succinogenes major paralogous domain-containing protein [Bacteroidales bacterium]